MNCGLGNNGGSQTIIMSANILSRMGHDVTIIDTGFNKHTWRLLEAKHKVIRYGSVYPKCDVIIGTGIKTFESTAKYKYADRKFHWLRGWETWQMSEIDMLNLFKRYPDVNLLTNGVGIERILKKNNLYSQIQLAGLDDCNSQIIHHYKEKPTLYIGGLVNTKHKTKQTGFIYDVFKYLCGYIDAELYTYGGEGVDSRFLFSHHHVSNPQIKQKTKIYKKIDFWLSPSISEGFHIPPAEFMLTGGVVVGVQAPLNGTAQYLRDNETGFVVKNSQVSIAECILSNYRNYDKLNELGNNAHNFILDEIGSREFNMKKFIKILESK